MLNKSFQPRPFDLGLAHQLRHVLVQKIDQRDAERHTDRGYDDAGKKNHEGLAGKLGKYPFAGHGIDIVVKYAVQAHENQRVLPHPDDGFGRWGELAQEENEQRPDDGREREPEHVPMGGGQDDHGIVVIEIERTLIQIEGKQHDEKGDQGGGRHYLNRRFVDKEIFSAKVDARQIEGVHGDRLMDEQEIVHPLFGQIQKVAVKVEEIADDVEGEDGDQDFQVRPGRVGIGFQEPEGEKMDHFHGKQHQQEP